MPGSGGVPLGGGGLPPGALQPGPYPDGGGDSGVVGQKMLPAATLVGIWKILTNYLQVIGMLRYLRWTQLIPEPLDFIEGLSSATTSSFRLSTLDCLIPGTPETKALARMISQALVLPLAVFLWCLGSLVFLWAMERFSWVTSRWVSTAWRKGRGKAVIWVLRVVDMTARGLAVLGMVGPYVPLKQYLRKTLLVTVIVLGYSFYEPFMSTMLQILQCQQVGLPMDSVQQSYADTHEAWLLGRAEVAGNGSAGEAAAAAVYGNSGPRQGLGTNEVYWGQEYSVQCFKGPHAALAFGLAVPGLVLLGLGVPLLSAWLLMSNKHQLKEDQFATKFSFLYAEYSTRQCFWESILMARKLLLLLVTICLGMAPGGDTAVALLQCQTAVLLLMLFLALQQWILPFRRTLLNRLETICLLATALTFGLLMFLPTRTGSEDRGQSGVAVLVLVVVVNGAAVLYLLYHAVRLSWVIMEDYTWAKWCKGVLSGMREQLVRVGRGCCRRRRHAP